MEPIGLNDVLACRARLAEEEALARRARTAEAGEQHAQMAALFQAQLDLLKTKRI
jgi:hypothetical protein